MRIYITGASCAGVTTLGQNLAMQLELRHADVDDYFWMLTNPPFTTKRPVSERVTLIQRALGGEAWVLTGSCMVWGRCTTGSSRFDRVRCDANTHSTATAGRS